MRSLGSGRPVLGRFAPRTVLLASCGACGLALAGWIAAPTSTSSIVALGVLGFCAAPLYPLAAARAYAACPERPGLVAAVEQLLTPLAIAAPLAVGIIAERWGLVAALGSLALQPLTVGLAVLATGGLVREAKP